MEWPGVETIPGVYAPLPLGAGGGCVGVSGELGVQAVPKVRYSGGRRDITGPCLEYLGRLKKPVWSDAASAADNRMGESPSPHAVVLAHLAGSGCWFLTLPPASSSLEPLGARAAFSATLGG